MKLENETQFLYGTAVKKYYTDNSASLRVRFSSTLEKIRNRID